MKKNTSKVKHPEWALKYKRKGTELRLIRGIYYLYEVTSKWNPQKKRSQKITGKFLGKITPEGFIESEKNKLKEGFEQSLKTPLQVKEYGASHFILEYFKQYNETLKEHFSDLWQDIIALAFVRLVYQAPVKNVGFYFERSHLSEIFSDITMGEKRVGALYRKIGSYRSKVAGFMKQFIEEKDNILIDATHLISRSRHIDIAKYGYNSAMQYDPQVNLMFLFSSQLQLPVFYRIVSGDIREVKAFQLTLQEAGIKEVTIIADKGFFSMANINELDKAKLTYIIPLKRDNSLIDYSPVVMHSKKGYEGYFKYQQRFIWYYTLQRDNKRVIVFYDDQLRSKEEYDYLIRIENKVDNYTIESFKEKQAWFGTLSIYDNNADKSPQQIYELYKTRGNIETMFDAMKNTLEADKSFMHNEDALQGWLFINFIALQWYYKIYLLLKQKKILANYSPKDLFMHLSEIKCIKINQQWRVAEFTRKTQFLLDKIQIPIT